jgi:hypothetical protein
VHWAANAAPVRPAMMIPVIIAPISRTIATPTRSAKACTVASGIVEEKASRAMAGYTGYLNPPDWPFPEIGWSVFPAFQKRGYATEAAIAARAAIARLGGPDRLVSYIDPENGASIRVAEKLGGEWHQRPSRSCRSACCSACWPCSRSSIGWGCCSRDDREDQRDLRATTRARAYAARRSELAMSGDGEGRRRSRQRRLLAVMLVKAVVTGGLLRLGGAGHDGGHHVRSHILIEVLPSDEGVEDPGPPEVARLPCAHWISRKAAATCLDAEPASP